MTVSRSATNNEKVSPVSGKRGRVLANSDRIFLKFGSYGIDVLENGHGLRVSDLFSIHDGVKINRTLAVVLYPTQVETAFAKEHTDIIGGQSIGIVFNKSGWQIDKRHLYFGTIEAAPVAPASGSFFRVGQVPLAIHIYALLVKQNGAAFHYATIAEVHHPDYLTLEDLNAVYGEAFETSAEEGKSIEALLKVVKDRLQRT